MTSTGKGFLRSFYYKKILENKMQFYIYFENPLIMTSGTFQTESVLKFSDLILNSSQLRLITSSHAILCKYLIYYLPNDIIIEHVGYILSLELQTRES